MSDVAIPPAVPDAPQPRPRILIVDDQRNMRTTTALVLRQQGYQVTEAESGEAALSRLLAEPVDVVLTDLKMAPLDGLAVLRGALEISPSTQVIVMTGYGTVESAVEAMQQGAYDYVTKPFKESELLMRVQRALEQRRLLVDVGLFSDEFRQRYKLDNLVGRSAPMRELLTRLVRVAPTDVTVLITGASGTGKELIARAIHVNSKRSSRAFIPVNCAAISETLLESELFGHVKGAFIARFNQRNATRRTFTQGALKKMTAYDFPGNVRELENMVEQAAALAHSDEIDAADVFIEARTAVAPANPDTGVRTLAQEVDDA